MKLEWLEVENFRQFYGSQRIEFSQASDDNVTVIHGSNGSGKTTLLNAFLWLFYDDVTLPQAGHIASERALAEASPNETVAVRVTLQFQHQDRLYTAVREQSFQKTGQSDLSGTQTDDSVTLEYIDTDGNHQRRENPSSALKQIMPERLREIFFFDGETIDELTAQDGQEKVQSAIRNVMGLEILERSIRHMDTVEGRFENEMENHGGNELSELVQEKQDLEQQLGSKEEALADRRESKRQTESERADVEDRLSQLEESRDLQAERTHLREDLSSLEDEIDGLNDRIADEISDAGHLPFAMSALEETARMLQEKRQRGEIPSDMKRQFVEDLLEIDECICGRPLAAGTEPRERVQSWRERAGSSELEEAAMNIAGRLTELGEEQEVLYDEIEERLERRGLKRDQKQALIEQIDEISSKLSDEVTEDVAALESRRQDLEETIQDLTKDIGHLEGKVEELEAEITTIKSEIDGAREQNAKANLARRRAQTSGYIRERIESLFEQYQDEVRENVNDRVNDIFQEIIEKDYYAEITDEYALRILKDVGKAEKEPVAKSTGERQVASLSFIATLVSLARERWESDDSAEYFTGGIYPMLMDSPFGYLDPTYQQRVSRILPEMAEQVVVLVTQSQWSDAVAGEMDSVAGKRYELKYHDPSEDATVEYEHTEIVNKGGVV